MKLNRIENYWLIVIHILLLTLIVCKQILRFGEIISVVISRIAKGHLTNY